MAQVFVSDCNVSAKLIDWQAGTLQDPGLNLGTANVPLTTTRASNDMNCLGPRQVRIPVKLSAGTLTVNVSVHSGTPNFGTPTATLAIADTTQHELEVSTDAVNKFVSVQIVSGGGGAVVQKGAMFVTGKFAPGEGYHEARFGFQGFKDGDGTYSIAGLT